MLEKAQLERFNEMSAYYDKYESILGQVRSSSPAESLTRGNSAWSASRLLLLWDPSMC